MPEFSLHLKSVTPLLMNRLNDDPVVRAASFRGVFRYWLRALIGAVEQDIGALHAAESAVFGSTDMGSPVMVRARSSAQPDRSRALHVLPKDVWNRERTQRIDNGQVGFAAETTSITLTCLTHPLAPAFPPLLADAVLLAFQLGAFGKRSRRGGGSLEVIGADGWTGNAGDWNIPSDGEKLVDNLGQLLTRVRGNVATSLKASLLPYDASRHDANRPQFPSLREGYYRVLVQPAAVDLDDAYNMLWYVSGPSHHAKGPYGSTDRASAIHMKVARSSQGLHPMMTVLESGNERDWSSVDGVVSAALAGGFVAV